ncbi:MAG: PilZ domain-containing protein [Treponema sp.]|nr:PilZ domain-containing protein [Treponema sp.]
MPTIIAVIVVIVIIAILAKLYQIFKDRFRFIITGLDSKFNISEINMLWQVAKICNIKDPNTLYYSLPVLTRCMTQINNQAVKDGSDKSQKMQNLMGKLFNFRTKVQNESDEKKGLESTLELDKGQRLRIILPGKGVFISEIVNNGRDITISMPKQKNLIPVPAEDWLNKTVNVYLWRNGDARYVFDTTVLAHGIFLGKLCLHLKHSSQLLRTQKRQAVRAPCNINANLYIQHGDTINYNSVETAQGYRCLLEDISEKGALIRIGGKGQPNMKIKLQFTINNKLILMFGIVRGVEYNADINQTRLHFDCIHIEQQMRNDILSYVYNLLPESDREVYEAMKLTDSDAQEEQPFSPSDVNPLEGEKGYESEIHEDVKTDETENSEENIEETEMISVPDIEDVFGDTPPSTKDLIN